MIKGTSFLHLTSLHFTDTFPADSISSISQVPADFLGFKLISFTLFANRYLSSHTPASRISIANMAEENQINTTAPASANETQNAGESDKGKGKAPAASESVPVVSDDDEEESEEEQEEVQGKATREPACLPGLLC